ncbi:MAG: nucleoside 2-deoxyribosyltransferase, partial [Chloroflexota bacterium]
DFMTSYTFYFAGDIFDHKHLAGNALLAEAIWEGSNGRFLSRLPQSFEHAYTRGVDIRNMDLKAVMACDLGLFNFDGPDIDSGTVVEFMFAKMLDIPSVIFRSDFRGTSDSERQDWNLMATHYPRTEVVQIHSLGLYRELHEQAASTDDLLTTYYKQLAEPIVAAFDRVLDERPLTMTSPQFAEQLYQWATQFPASGFAEHCGVDFVEQVLTRKREKGLLN